MLCKLVKHVINDATITLDRNNLLSTIALIQNVKNWDENCSIEFLATLSTNKKYLKARFTKKILCFLSFV